MKTVQQYALNSFSFKLKKKYESQILVALRGFEYCKFGNFREDFISAKLRIFRENKTLAKWQNHLIVY